jgi:hypothetical protein
MHESPRLGPRTGGDTDAAVGPCLVPNPVAGLRIDHPFFNTPYGLFFSARDGAAGTAFRADLAVLAKFINSDIDGRIPRNSSISLSIDPYDDLLWVTIISSFQ